MNNSPNISSNSENERLARELGLRLQGLGHDLNTGDPLIALLDTYQQQFSVEELPNEQSIRMWDQIKGHTLSTPTAARIHSLFAPRYLSIAASILLIAALGIIWSVTSSQPELLMASGDQIETYQLEDGSEVILRPYSELYALPDNEKRSYSLQGEAVFEVVSDSDRPFTVRTPHGTVEVLGTEFNLSTWGDQSIVYLFEGKVAVYSNDGNEATLDPGQYVTFSVNTLSRPEQSSADIYTDWMNNTIVFSGSGLGDIFQELEQHFNIRIISDEDSRAEPVSGTLRLTDLELTLTDLELVLGGEFTKVENRTYRFELMD